MEKTDTILDIMDRLNIGEETKNGKTVFDNLKRCNQHALDIIWNSVVNLNQ